MSTVVTGDEGRFRESDTVTANCRIQIESDLWVVVRLLASTDVT
jgi:hypothetical protein